MSITEYKRAKSDLCYWFKLIYSQLGGIEIKREFRVNMDIKGDSVLAYLGAILLYWYCLKIYSPFLKN